MATATFTIPRAIPNGAAPDPTYARTIVSEVRAALTALGFVRTADTGQVDPATLTYSNLPIGQVPTFGYEIWRFTDPLQATAPLFFKLEYAASFNNGTTSLWRHIGLWVTVGKGSDGAGNITGVLAPRAFAGTGHANISADQGFGSCIASGDGSGLALVLCQDSFPGRAPAVLIDRSRDHTGAATGDGVAVATSGYAAAALNALPLAATPTSTSTSNMLTPNRLVAANHATELGTDGVVPVLVPLKVGGGILGTGRGLANGILTPLFPWVVYPPGVAPWQVLLGMSYVAADDPNGTFTVRVGGVDRTFRSVPISNASHAWGIALDPGQVQTGAVSGSSLLGLAILWE